MLPVADQAGGVAGQAGGRGRRFAGDQENLVFGQFLIFGRDGAQRWPWRGEPEGPRGRQRTAGEILQSGRKAETARPPARQWCGQIDGKTLWIQPLALAARPAGTIDGRGRAAPERDHRRGKTHHDLARRRHHPFRRETRHAGPRLPDQRHGGEAKQQPRAQQAPGHPGRRCRHEPSLPGSVRSNKR